MADANMLQLPVASSVDGSEYAWIVQGGTDKRATLAEIANTATGFVPLARTINTPSNSGLTGGGALSADLTLGFLPNNLPAKLAMAVADSFAINDVAASNTPAKATFPNAMKALTGLAALAVPDLVNDYLIINRASDGDTYKVNPSALGLAAGNLPAGGTTGQALVKQSATNYDAAWGTLPAVGGGTGHAVYAVGDILYADTTATLARLADVAVGNVLLSGGIGTAPAWGKVNLASAVTGILPPANGGTGVNNGSSTITLGGSLTLSGAFTTAFTITGNTSVTFPTSGTLATTAGASIPAIAQGDLLYGSATNVLSALAKDSNATRYLSNTGTSNNPAWAQINLANGVSGLLPLANGGTNANLAASNGGLVYSTASALAILAGTATAGQIPRSGSNAAPSWSTATYPATAAAGTVLGAATANTIAATATPTLGVPGSVVGSLSFANATSGTITIAPTTGALGSVTLTLPAATDTFAVLAAPQALTNKTYNGLTVTTTTGTLTIANGKTLTISNSLTFTGTDSTSFAFPATSSAVLTTGNTALITSGYTVTPNNLGNITSFTIDPTLGNYQYGTNNGAATWTAPTADCAVDILVTNDASAGSITFSGFTVSSSTGDPLTTTDTNRFLISIRRINSVSTYTIKALQ
jgi:hypothetical protein